MSNSNLLSETKEKSNWGKLYYFIWYETSEMKIRDVLEDVKPMKKAETKRLMKICKEYDWI